MVFLCFSALSSGDKVSCFRLTHTDTDKHVRSGSFTDVSDHTVQQNNPWILREARLKAQFLPFRTRQTVISPSFCPCPARPSCDCSLSLSSCFGRIAARSRSWRPSSVYSPLLPTCCELEAGMIYPGAQPETASFNFQGHSNVIQEFQGVPVVLGYIHNFEFYSSYRQLQQTP